QCGLISVINGAINAVAETKVFGQSNLNVVDGRDVAACTNILDQLAVVFSRQQRLDLLFQAEAAPEISLLHRWNDTLFWGFDPPLQPGGGAGATAGRRVARGRRW